METTAGTYALILSSRVVRPLAIGRRGQLDVRRGFYVYVGSAFGPGGVRARVAHHQKLAVRPHWHIDYLRRVTQLEETWVTYDPVRREHQWAEMFGRLRGATIPLAGFGATDCACEAHLYFFRTRPVRSAFWNEVQSSLRSHGHLLCYRASLAPRRASFAIAR
jgi:Uri superfamily endonuclease